MARTGREFKGPLKPIWCAGCGDFNVLACVQEAMGRLGWEPKDVALIGGIGCSGRFPHFVNAYGFHTVHGRSLPVATGTHLANPNLHVIAVGGDGDGFAIGLGHFLHAARRNPRLTYLVMDNEVYGQTKGHPSPTAPSEARINPIALAVAAGCSFVARAYSARTDELVGLLQRALQHPGFAFVDIISPCTTFHDTYEDLKTRVQPLPEDHDPADGFGATRFSESADPIFLGVFYERTRPGMRDVVKHPARSQGPLASLAEELGLVGGA